MRVKPKKPTKTRMPWRSKRHYPVSERLAFPTYQIIRIDSPLVHYTTSTDVKSVVKYHQGWYEPEGFISDSSN